MIVIALLAHLVKIVTKLLTDIYVILCS